MGLDLTYYADTAACQRTYFTLHSFLLSDVYKSSRQSFGLINAFPPLKFKLKFPECMMKYAMFSGHLPTSVTGDFAFYLSCLSLVKHKNIISISLRTQWYVLYVHVIYLQFVKAPVKLPISTWCLILGLSIDMKDLKPGRWFCEVKTVLPQARSL